MNVKPPVRVEISPPVAWVILDRPEEGNPISESLADALRETWVSLSRDGTLRAIGIGASGPSFSIGTRKGAAPIEGSFGPRSCGCELPVLVELAGDIASGAFQLLGEATFVLAIPDVVLTTPLDMATRIEVRGLRPRISESQIRRLALLGPFEPLTAIRAAQLGLIDELVAPWDMRRRSIAILTALAASVTKR
jgi:enoyl-CoA hydratase